MREFDALCLTPGTLKAPEEIKALREREQVSRPVFASYLNVRKEAVSKWERGNEATGRAHTEAAELGEDEAAAGDSLRNCCFAVPRSCLMDSEVARSRMIGKPPLSMTSKF